MKNIVFFLNDIQDMWLISYLLRPGSHVLYRRTGKITSPHFHLKTLNYLKLNLVEVTGEKDPQFISALENCDYFVTKECLPFHGEHRFREKVISIGWFAEGVHLPGINHPVPGGEKGYNIRDAYLRHYIAEEGIPFLKYLGYENVFGKSPKYYCLNMFDRESACQRLGLDPARKYMMIMPNPIYDFSQENIEILRAITEYCNKNSITAILKNKMKYGEFLKDQIENAVFLGGNDLVVHQTLLALNICEFSVGRVTCAVAESERVGGRFISLWREEAVTHDDGMEKVYDDVHRIGADYRIVRSDNILTVHNKTQLVDIRDRLFEFMKNSSAQNFSKHHEIDEFIGKNILS
tara:strand:- start:75 stop:1121 length:1047 start_codon:yes stop_codon:yes gene_type:complete